MGSRRGWLVALMLLNPFTGPARADDIATLPLGDPARAYLMGSGEAGQVIRCIGEGAPGAVEIDALAAELSQADVVIIGESHTDIAGHRTQWRLVEALAKTGKPLALGMEFFEITDDEALGAFVAGKDDVPTMLEKTGWYAGGSYNFEYYRPMLETCRATGSPIYGVNVPREWVRTVSRQGLDALTPEQRERVGEVGPVNERHKYLVNQMMSGLGAAMPQMFEGMYRGQTVWDSAMAHSILRAHRAHVQDGKPRTIVVIVGSGHMSHGLAIPARLKELDASLKVRTLAPVQGVLPDDDARLHPGFERKETAVFSLGYADYVYILPDSGGAEEFPQAGVRVGPAAGTTSGPMQILGVTPGGLGERAGLRKGDEVIAIGSASPTSAADAGYILGTLRWGDRVEWKLRRAGREVSIPMIVVPPTDREEDWLKSETASSLLDTFDPASDRSYHDPKGFKPAGTVARLVAFRKKPTRIDVVRDGVLLETWDLDAAGRPIRGIFAAPAGDGAVRVVITRDDAGKATSVKRLDPDGKEVPGARDPHADMTK